MDATHNKRRFEAGGTLTIFSFDTGAVGVEFVAWLRIDAFSDGAGVSGGEL